MRRVLVGCYATALVAAGCHNGSLGGSGTSLSQAQDVPHDASTSSAHARLMLPDLQALVNQGLLPEVVLGGASQCAEAAFHSTDDVEVLASAQSRFPETGVVLYRYTFHSTRSGDIALCDIGADGKSADYRTLAEHERLARIAKHGRMDSGLESIVADMGADESRWVLAWIPVSTPNVGAASNLFRDRDAASAESTRVDKVVTDALPSILAQLPPDTRFVQVGHGSPFVRFHLRRADILALSKTNLVGNLFDGEERSIVPLAATCDANQYSLTNTDQVHRS